MHQKPSPPILTPPNLIHISKVNILLIRQILKGVHVALILLGARVAALVDAAQVEAQEDDDQQQQHVAAHVRAEGDEVARGVVVAEDLGAWRGEG